MSTPRPEGLDLDEPAGLVSWEEARRRCEALRESGRTVVFTNGCFDLLHAGHVRYLADARELGDLLVVGLNSDDSVQRLKGEGRPWNSAAARATVLLGLRSVDLVIVFDQDTPLELIQHLRPSILCKGADYAPDEVVGRPEVEADGGRLVLIPFVTGFSSSALMARIRETDGTP
ncbi:MAG: D-glycero-beta-D-manno-heptose 1-phosphate adenylyltransferase [Candidatus Eisenbacteria bacterium]|uniref:D-glycero-beta-D-manno-heptose 1-phosphate adenylyltransferase n=1 Tax=Eiseniibacteriota bacterium TaxID=2212470 RepID=A0A956SC60_UNCEI|nr:D-glycero-beta-D-manno-heptose 1-phosphate adenylyltransferase [Candidatus Eisenbacteria bacterium]